MSNGAPHLTVVRAAAGCGKTTDLAARYLADLARGVAADQAVAITFTRRAAAELKERVSLALLACLPDARGDGARARLGPVWDQVYAAVCPRDPAVARSALEVLPDAPIGTTDTFVSRLLSEFALDAAMPLPDGSAVALDVPIGAGGGTAAALHRAARRLLDPPDGTVSPEVQVLTRAFTLDELVPMLASRGRWDELRGADTAEVLGPWTGPLGRVTGVALAGQAKGDRTDPDAWTAVLQDLTNASGAWAVPEVARWAAGGCAPAATPLAAFGWLVSLDLRRAGAKALVRALEDEVVPLGPGSLNLWQLVNALKYPYDDPAMVERADGLRRALDTVRRAVVAQGLREAALAGELGYDELLRSAVHLCEHPPAGLVGRFRTLLVDEVQDANPMQHRLYRALASLPGTEAVFVGDSRQSIYLFRDAEPELLRALEATHADPRELRVNRRSAPRLVAAHRALFDRLDAPMRRERWRPPTSLASLEADPANAGLALDPAFHTPDAPVQIVVPAEEGNVKDDDLDRRALDVFLERLGNALREPGHAGDTAVVLASNWGVAERACRHLRARTGRADAAFVEGATGRNGSSRVADDVRVFLRALLHPDDELAWLAVWRHPVVGLTDAALARIVAGRGLWARDGAGAAAPWRRDRRVHLGWLASADGLEDPHDAPDVAAFARAVGPLREARESLGRRPTSAVLDRLWSRLDYRTVLSAGPGGADDLAELEVLLDFVRERDARGLPADALLVEFDDEATERPQVRLERPPGHIACTTLFQAKGLAWDHVCVLRVGHLVRGRLDSDVRAGWMALPDQTRVRLDGLVFDPHGGLSDVPDPLARLATRLHHLRLTEECARFAYVAITRARRSVTLALPRRPPKLDPRVGRQFKDLLPEAWATEPIPDVVVVRRGSAEAPAAPSAGWAVATDREVDAEPEPPTSWDERAPSSVGAFLTGEDRARFAASVADRVRLQRGLFVGRRPIVAPGTDPATGLGLPGHPLGALSPADWGTLAHGWFASWGFRGEPTREAVSRYLVDEWRGDDDALAAWLLAMSEQLRAVGGPLWTWVTDPKVRLRFEHPMLGTSRVEGRDVVLSGRMDLLVEWPRGRCAVVDFKAGHKAPTGHDDLVTGASLRTYAFQLHAYSDALHRMGRTVDAVALWFVRTGTQVLWR